MTFSRLRIPIVVLTLAAACLTQGMLISPEISGSENTPLWTQTSGPPGGGFQVIEISPKDSNILFAGSNRSLFRSTDRGEHWQRVEALHQLSVSRELRVSLVAFDPRNPEIVYAVTQAGVSKSEDAGRSWRKIDKGMPPEQWVFSIVINPDNPDIIYTASKNGQNKGKDTRDFYGMVMKSTDGGESWFEIMNGLDKNEEFYQLVMYPDSHNILFLSSWGGVYFTDNGGESWQPINDGLDVAPGVVNNVANNLDIDAEGRYLYLGTGGHGVYRADLRQLNLEKN